MSVGTPYTDKDGRQGTEHQDAIDEMRYFLRTVRETKAPAAQSMVERRIARLKQEHSGQNFDFSYKRR
jgi:hypothetical protein